MSDETSPETVVETAPEPTAVVADAVAVAMPEAPPEPEPEPAPQPKVAPRDRLKLAFVASEIAPFAKTGGLADVVAGLPAYLHRQGHDVRVFVPLYSQIDLRRHPMTPVDFLRHVTIHLGGVYSFTFSVYVSALPGSDLQIYFVHCPDLFDRGGLYTGDWDDHLRFALLQRAAIESWQRMGWGPDVVHANDWHAALLPIYLRTIYGWDRLFAHTKTVLTIHNIAYQGVFPADVVGNLGLWDFRSRLFQHDLDRGMVNFLKTGLLYADVITTVSRTYAREIQTEGFGQGLDPLLRERRDSVVGIVNGIDYGTWNPSTDPYLTHHYGIDDVAEGKAANRASLLSELSLPDGPRAAVLGAISRLTPQKGFDLLFDALPEALRHLDLRLVVLGSGEQRYEDFFVTLQRTFPRKVVYYRGYHEELAHRIEAAADVFLMPSLFEPCGLNQMYSLRYGTPPLVRKTGGLADTVELWNPKTGRGTGFVFETYDRAGIGWALRYALTTFQDKAAWAQLRRNGMEQDFSWERQGAEYERLYRRLLGRQE